MLINLFLLISLFNPNNTYAQAPGGEDFVPKDGPYHPGIGHTPPPPPLAGKEEIKAQAITEQNPVSSAGNFRLDIYKEIGLNPKDGTSDKITADYKANYKDAEKKYHNIFGADGSVKTDYLASVINCKGFDPVKCSEKDLPKSTPVMEYDARVKYSHQYTVDYYNNLKSAEAKSGTYGRATGLGVGTDSYRFSKELIDARLNIAKLQYQLMASENGLKRSAFIPEQRKAAKEAKKDAEIKMKTALTKFNSKLDSLAGATFNKGDTEKDKTDKERIITALGDTEKDLNVSIAQVKTDEIYDSIPAGLEVCKGYDKLALKDKEKCDTLARKYNVAAATGGNVWDVKLITQDCDTITKLTPLFDTAISLVGMFKSVDLEKCIMASGVKNCANEIGTVRNIYSDPFNQTAQYADLIDMKINPSFTTAGTQTPTSMTIGGTQPSNPLSAYTPTTTSQEPTGTGADTENKVNSTTGAAILNNIASRVTATGTGANNFNSQYSDPINSIMNYNNNLSGAMTSWIDPNIYLNNAKSVQSILDQAKGTGTRYSQDTNTTTTEAVRQKITEINAQKAALFQQLVDEVARGNSDSYYLKYGSLSEQQQEAAAHMAQSPGLVNYIKIQMAALDNQSQLYYMNMARIINQTGTTTENTFDLSSMYASNGNAVYGKRSLNLKPLKTPVIRITYVLKDGWQDEFKKYIANMLQKAEESKKKMNLAKAKMQQLLSQKVPIIPLEKMPSTIKVAYEIRNMENIETVAKKNMANIDKAMEYHRSRKMETPSNIYSQYEKDAATLKKSMQNVVSAIDRTKPNLEKSYAILSNMDIEVPKAEALKKVAKRMVDQGL
ncbi:MAG: hypothetical protein NTY22_00380 [Proteobacteria bacterium]|nr:hypothetical protein [Pseudomonadota bacterium]